MDHSQCTEIVTPQWIEHTCPPCPHGLERGGAYDLTGNPEIDAMQRDFKLRAIEKLRCDSAQHDEALARMVKAS